MSMTQLSRAMGAHVERGRRKLVGSLPYDPNYGYDPSPIFDIVSGIVLVVLVLVLLCLVVSILDPKGGFWGPPLDWVNRKVDSINDVLRALPFLIIGDREEE